jgi:hypothetical protein
MTGDQLTLDLEAHHEEENGHQGIVHQLNQRQRVPVVFESQIADP